MNDDFDNLTKQAEEVEALASIYGKEWSVENVSDRSYSVLVNDDKQHNSITLKFVLPVEYPSLAPPYYQLSAPWLRREEVQQLKDCLEDVYLQNIGNSVLYEMIEKAREFLTSYVSQQEQPTLQQATYHQELHINDQEQSKPQTELTPNIYHGDTIVDRKSTFQGHLAEVTEISQVESVLKKLLENRKISNATHNIMAYRIYYNEKGNIAQDCDDDGETAAGRRLLHLLQILDVKNVIVIVSRWYGGILLGPDRFKHINNSARNVLQSCGYCSNTDQDATRHESHHQGKKSAKKR